MVASKQEAVFHPPSKQKFDNFGEQKIIFTYCTRIRNII